MIIFLHWMGLRGMFLNFSVRSAARALLFCMGFHRITEIRPRRPTGKRSSETTGGIRIVISNHVSLVEILHLIVFSSGGHWTSPLPTLVCKASVFDIPLFGYVAKNMLHCIPVIRSSSASTKLSAHSSAKTLPMKSSSSRIYEWIERQKANQSLESSTLIIFPEGTTSNGTGLLQFRGGAFLAGRPVHPVLYRLNNGNSPSFIPTFESIFTPYWLWRLLSEPWNIMSVEHLPSVIPTKEELSAGKPHHKFKERTQDIMATALNSRIHHLGYMDKLVYHKCLRAAFSGQYDGQEILLGSKVSDCLGDRIRYKIVKASCCRSLIAMLLTPQPFRTSHFNLHKEQ